VAEELVAIDYGHVPVEQDRFRQSMPAGLERLLAVLGFEDMEVQPFQNPPCHLADDA